MSGANLIDDQAGTSLPGLAAWVHDVAELTKPDDVVWCDGSEDEWERLTSLLVENGTFMRLKSAAAPEQLLVRLRPCEPSLGAVSGPRRPPRLTFAAAWHGSPAGYYDMPSAGHSPITDSGLFVAAFGQHVVEWAPHAGSRLDDCPEPKH
jgi:hypothetical protein